jgi:hypothetical protein
VKRAEKKDGKLAGLAKARTKAWYDFVYKKVGAGSVRDLSANLEAKGVKATWATYSSLTSAPKEDTLRAVEKVLPGSSWEYLDGPEGIPLWPVLEGDKTRAKLFLTRVFALYDFYSPKRTLIQKWDALADLLMKECVGQAWAGVHKEFGQLVQDPSRNDMRDAIAEVKLAPKFLMAISALAVQSYSSEDKAAWDYASYFMYAIDGEPVRSVWGEAVADYLTEWTKDKS